MGRTMYSGTMRIWLWATNYPANAEVRSRRPTRSVANLSPTLNISAFSAPTSI